MRQFDYSYEDFVHEQMRGEVHGVFIDDTGSPGLHSTPHGLNPDRKSWVAVVVDKSLMPEVWRQLHLALEELQALVPCRELHFANIYMGRSSFKGLDWKIRMAIFRFMVHLFKEYNLQIIVQTLTPESLPEWRSFLNISLRKLALFDLNSHVDLALFILLIRVRAYLKEEFLDGQRLARVFVDEGFKKDGRAMLLKPFDDVFADGLVCFARSDTILPIQLADFAAFCLNRSQLLLDKPKLEHRDREFLEITSPITENYRNLNNMTVALIGRRRPPG